MENELNIIWLGNLHLKFYTWNPKRYRIKRTCTNAMTLQFWKLKSKIEKSEKLIRGLKDINVFIFKNLGIIRDREISIEVYNKMIKLLNIYGG